MSAGKNARRQARDMKADPAFGSHEIDAFLCESCEGLGEVRCLCAGSLCACQNGGWKPCADCGRTGGLMIERTDHAE